MDSTTKFLAYLKEIQADMGTTLFAGVDDDEDDSPLATVTSLRRTPNHADKQTPDA